MEAKKSFAKAFTSGIEDKTQEISMHTKVDPSIFTMFLETCIKLLCDSKAVESLHELINKCVIKEKFLDGHQVVKKLGKHKAQTWCEMRLTAQIGDYEMD